MNDSLFDRCRTNTNIDSDVFVGIRRKDEYYEVNFPLGYHRSEDEKGLRKDILSLMNVLAKHTDKKASEVYVGLDQDGPAGIPVQAYLFLIKDFFERGYYKERDTYRQIAKRGKIDWSRTIRTQKPLLQENAAYYLDFVVKKNTINEDELITLVHEYCVYESFEKFGWLFTSFVPPKPKIRLHRKMMLVVVNDKLQSTFNDRNRRLFRNMIAVIRAMKDDAGSDFRYGTYHFEYVWEKMIDRVFGISEKEEYFPKTTWTLADGRKRDNAFLRPDSIMRTDKRVYVLDAKYYKFGWSGMPGHLPESASINKQIAYGEYIAKSEKFMADGEHPMVYNAFIMPYDSHGKKFATGTPMYYIGSATGDWKSNKKKYENVVGILMDVKYLMGIDSRMDRSEILKLAELIERNCPV
ncbi:MAG: LlaJI family restriction endonuclease [Eubacterium sp.]|nr:LlaJI family restriction endonuclease [Eubacterium sp.]MCM1238407.1 LlaJI family restriction endonuclease [Lachnospiraceae bacterium]MCM1303572.1 LlaJI family restriction endonuclease [Butyrivibrio sp.]MCM1343296.1 LlaJI family restriction endonuclease [Muribaculaceae bacterium]